MNTCVYSALSNDLMLELINLKEKKKNTAININCYYLYFPVYKNLTAANKIEINEASMNI